MKTGRNPHAAVIGNAMGDVTIHSTQYMSDADLRAIAAYLKTLSPGPADGSRFTENEATARALQAGVNDSRGAELYVDNCAGCHRTDATGYPRVFPAIAGNSIVLASKSDSLVRLILAGNRMPVTATAPSALGMPGFDWRLNDDEVAQLATYLRSQWGNAAPPVVVETVIRIRADLSRERGQAAHDR
jgi:mono/diheme cytochrome c family protein